jgi:hypothetical protein
MNDDPEFRKEVLRRAREGGLLNQLIDETIKMDWIPDERIHLDLEVSFWHLHPGGVGNGSTSADFETAKMMITGQIIFLDRPLAGYESA